MTLTPEQRDGLRALAEKATPGPWSVHAEPYEGMVLAVGADEETVYATDADMALMGAARTALPALLDALDAAEAARDTAERQVQAVRDVLAHHPYGGPDQEDAIRAALDGEAGR